MKRRSLWWGLLPVAGLLLTVAAGAAPRRDVATLGSDLPARTAELAPPSHEREVARVVADHLERFHYTRRGIDDTLAREWFDSYLERLDYNRTIFLAEDIAAFEAYRDTFDDIVDQRRPDLSAPVYMFTLNRQRLRSRLAFAIEQLRKGVDVTNKETMPIDRNEAKAGWPKTEAEANDLWRQRVEDEWIGAKLDGDSDAEIRDRLVQRYENWAKMLDTEESTDVVETWVSSLARTYDPHSEWFKPAKNDDFDIEITNSVSGIGASLRRDGDKTVIVQLIAGGPAKKDGRLMNDDVILAVGEGKRGEFVDVVGWRIEKVVKLIRGEVGSQVRLRIEHPDDTREEITITRALVTLEDSAAEHELVEVRGRKLGVVDLPSFYVDPNGIRNRNGRRASSDVRAALKDLNEKGAEGLILDLRDNGGGSLIEAVDVTGLFITTGPVVQVRLRDGKIEALHDDNPNVAWVKDMIVLTNGASASASEIVAGALQDYGRAIVVGAEQTHGKGTVQQVLPLTNRLSGRHNEPVGGALKLTVQKFYRVNGASTQNRGVLSDIVLPSQWDGLDIYESNLDHALPWDRIPPAPYIRVRDDADVVPRLAEASKTRVAASDDFARLGRLLGERETLNEMTEISLHYPTRKKEYEARDSRIGDAAEAHGGTKDGDDDDKPDDFVLDEALEILSDLLDARSVGR